MNDDPDPAHDDELHAFVDGQLDPRRLPAVLSRLQQRPDDATRVLQWHAQRLQLRHLARSIDPGPAPATLGDTVRRAVGRSGRRRPWLQAAAALLMVTAGFTGGRHWGATHGVTVNGDELAATRVVPGQGLVAGQGHGLAAATPMFVREAVAAHAAFVPETRHPVEVTAADEAHLLQWLGRRLGAPLKAPTLARLGYHLLGGRLLPGEGSPRAQFMYENPRGTRVTLFVTVFDPAHPPDATAFRTVRSGAEDTFYWVEDRFGYALSAAASSPDLQALAHEVYGQLQR